MKIYIVKIYPTEHKWESDACICGVFTNKKALASCIADHLNDFNFYGDFDPYNAAFDGHISDINSYSETAYIETIDSNIWNDNGLF